MAMLQEYLESGDAEEAAACIGELRLPQYDFYVVKRALTLALDRRDREREAVSALLSNLYGRALSPAQMQKARVVTARRSAHASPVKFVEPSSLERRGAAACCRSSMFNLVR